MMDPSLLLAQALCTTGGLLLLPLVAVYTQQ
jgi:hypothetical protein